MILSSFWQNPAVIGILVGGPSAALGYLGYRRSVKLDKIAEQAGVATASTAQIGQVVEGLNDIIENLQKDNAVLRADMARVREMVKTCHDRIDEVERESVDLRTKNRELEREVRELRAENKALKEEEQRLTARILVLENGRQPPPTTT